MINKKDFRKWLDDNTEHSDAVKRDITSRMKRADTLMEWEPTTTYLYRLEQEESFKKLSTSVKSQIRRAVKYYIEFIKNNITN